MEAITRQQAHERGQLKFFSGKPCKRGHVAERYVSTNGCVECLGSFRKIGLGPSRELRPIVPAVLYVPHDLLPQLVDAFNDHLAAATMAWVEALGLMTPDRAAGYAALAKTVAGKRKLRDVQMANRATVPPVPAVPAVPQGVASIRR